MVHTRKSFSDECILLPLYVYNNHQDTKSARLIAECKRTLTVILLIMYGSIPVVTIPPGNVTQHSPGVGNCVDCLVPGVDTENRNARYARGLVPSLQARWAVWQDGVRNFVGNTQGLILNTWIFSPSPAPFFNLHAPTLLPNETPFSIYPGGGKYAL